MTGHRFRQPYLWPTIVAVVPIVWLGGHTIPARPGVPCREPVVTFDRTCHAFGRVSTGGRLVHTFRWTNESSEPVKVTAVKTTCGCLAHNEGRDSVAPGESGFITVELRTHGMEAPARLKKTAWAELSTNERKHAFALTMTADLRPDVTAEPAEVVFNPQGPDGLVRGAGRRGPVPAMGQARSHGQADLVDGPGRVLFGLLGGYVCYRWATQLYGVPAGLLALSLWCFSPTILGHASLLMPDAAAAAMGVLAGHTFWHWLKRSTWSQGLLAGMVLGLAELTKTTLLVLYPVLPAIWLFDRCVRSRGRSLAEWSRDVAMLSAMFMASLLVINIGYDFEGSLQKLKYYEFQSRMLSDEPTRADGSAQWGNRFAGGPLGEFWVPLPRSFVQGIDTQKVDFERKMRSYLRGEWRIGGWWYFYG